MLNLHGKVAEASVANVFAWIDGTLVTPPTIDGALPGITRATVIQLARDLGIETQIRSIGQAEPMRAEEVFLSGSGARLVPVGRLDAVAIGSGKRPVFERIDDAFREYTLHAAEVSLSAAQPQSADAHDNCVNADVMRRTQLVEQSRALETVVGIEFRWLLLGGGPRLSDHMVRREGSVAAPYSLLAP